ncbi:hypothetical protein [Desulfonatronovibrio hydrogenovorans]|uniref:hypothetical protein n=1 Tax=Desulfonatronovibrio hydrogenovorans TaxID=53245 RepID=UPI000A04AA50|nr:hypothetical protein [Desulfonatronovibrio hydrogenovorans]
MSDDEGISGFYNLTSQLYRLRFINPFDPDILPRLFGRPWFTYLSFEKPLVHKFPAPFSRQPFIWAPNKSGQVSKPVADMKVFRSDPAGFQTDTYPG